MISLLAMRGVKDVMILGIIVKLVAILKKWTQINANRIVLTKQCVDKDIRSIE